MTIVCATHFTDSSFAAVKVAAGLAHRHGQPLWLVSVLPNRNTDDEIESAVDDALLLEAAALASSGVDVQTAVLHGPLEHAVAQFCTAKQALLLVVGDTRSLDTFAYGLELPLLVVRDFKPFEAWTRGSGPLQVMLALDHTWSAAVARDWIRRLSEYGPIELIAARIWWPRDEYARRGLPVPADGEGHASLVKTMHDETRAALAGLPSGVSHRVQIEIGVGHLGEQLLALAAVEQVEVLVLGANPLHAPMSLLRSVSHEVLRDAPMSVACIPGRLNLLGRPSPVRLVTDFPDLR